MVKRTITISTILLILTIAVGLIVMLNKSSFAADDDIASGTSGTCSWVIDREGVLTVYPTDGVSGVLGSGETALPPWSNMRSSITKVVVRPGVKTNDSSYQLFAYLDNCTEIDVTGLDTSSTTYIWQMFSNNPRLENIDVSNFDTSHCNTLGNVFSNCERLKSLDLSNWDVSNIENLNGLMMNCPSLKYVDISSFDTRNIRMMGNVFYGCTSLTEIKIGENFSFYGIATSDRYRILFPTPSNSQYTGKWIREDGAYGPYMPEELKTNYNSRMAGTWICESAENAYAVLDANDTLNFIRAKVVIEDNTIGEVDSISGGEFTGTIFTVNESSTRANRTWNSIRLQVKKVQFVDEIKPKSTSQWFKDFNNCTEIDLSKLNTSDVENMSEMFYYCIELTSIDVSKFDTHNVTNMYLMFSGCIRLTSLDVSKFDTSQVKNMSFLFSNCSSLKSIDVSNFNTNNVTEMSCMFNSCYSLISLDLSRFDTSKVTNMANMFTFCDTLKSVVLGENFSFSGKNITEINKKAILPTPSSTFPYTEKWIKDDKSEGPYIPEELRDNYTYAMAGTWVWDEETIEYSVNYSYLGKVPNNTSELPETRFYTIGEEVIVSQNATAPGYTFSGWSRTGTFEMPAENVEITGSFTANTDTPYKVEHYLEDLKEGEYTLTKTDNLTGTTDTEATATAKDYEGFTFDNSIGGTKLSGNIDGDGNLVLKLYYKRNSYNVTYAYTGDIPDDASSLPQAQTYKYGANISVPDDSTAEGYTFSGWIKDYITMPAQDIEITGYFIENPKSYNYKVEYYFDGELDDSLEEILNAEKDEEISLTPQTPLKHGERNYILVSDNHKITISINDEENIINVYYETDVLDYEIDNSEDTIEGDGIPDKYQIAIYYKVENGSWDDGTKGTKTDVITLKDQNGNYAEDGTGELNVPQVGNKPAEGYTNGSWNKKIPKMVSSKDNGKEFIYSYKIISKANISRAEGKLSNPKTDDIMHNYLLVGAIGILALIIVRKIKRKYSRKAKKIQY